MNSLIFLHEVMKKMKAGTISKSAAGAHGSPTPTGGRWVNNFNLKLKKVPQAFEDSLVRTSEVMDDAHTGTKYLELGAPLASLATIEAKLNKVITKVDLIERGESRTWDQMDTLRNGQNDILKGQNDILNGQKAVLRSLTHEVITMNAVVKDRISTTHPTRKTRYLLAFTGGLAGGVAGGVVVSLLLRLGSLSEVPVSILDFLTHLAGV